MSDHHALHVAARDVREAFVVRDGAAVATPEELARWFAEDVDDVLRKQADG